MTGINVIVNNSVRPHVASDYLLQDTINIRVKIHTRWPGKSEHSSLSTENIKNVKTRYMLYIV